MPEPEAEPQAEGAAMTTKPTAVEAARLALESKPRQRRPEVKQIPEPQFLKEAGRKALTLLLRELADGPRRVSEIEEMAKAEGIGVKALERARGFVCARPPRKHGMPGSDDQFWTMELRSPLPGWLARRGVRP
jgi:hypothetical protein